MPAYEDLFKRICKNHEIIYASDEGGAKILGTGEEVHHATLRSLVTKCEVEIRPASGGRYIGTKWSYWDNIIAAEATAHDTLAFKAAEKVNKMALLIHWAAEGEQALTGAKMDAAWVAETHREEWARAFVKKDDNGCWILDIPDTLDACLDRIEQATNE